MMRSIAAVLAGVLVTVALVLALTFLSAAALGLGPNAAPTPAYLAVNLTGSALAGALGGATAVKLAPHAPHGHVIALAIVILLLSLPTLFTPPAPGQPSWYGAVVSVIGPVSVAIGGLLAARRSAVS